MPESQVKKLKIAAYSMDGIGHLSAVIGVLQPFVERGHDVFFICNKEFKGKFERYGVREHVLVREMTPEEEAVAMTHAKNAGKALLASGLLSAKSPIEKLSCLNGTGFLDEIIGWIEKQNPQIEQILLEEKPDVIIFDHFMIPPCFFKLNIPYVMVHSPSPLFVYSDERLPPPFSGLRMDSDRSKWEEFRQLGDQCFFEAIRRGQRTLLQNAQIEVPESNDKIFMSPYLNVYAYPKELDYSSIVPIPEKVFALDAFSRSEPDMGDFKLPENFLNRPEGEALIYLSMGSMGGADVELMKKLVEYVSNSKHKFVVVKGPRGDEYTVDSPNIFAGNFLPQTAILPMCDLVITHGGNNSTTETFFAAKPMIVMPLFVDQYDNATRVEECGFGVQFNPYTVTKDELFEAIDRILADAALRERLEAVSKRMAQDNTKGKLADKVEQLVREHREQN